MGCCDQPRLKGLRPMDAAKLCEFLFDQEIAKTGFDFIMLDLVAITVYFQLY